MALNVGHDFKKRWLDAPEIVRQSFLDDLNRVCDLLSPQSDLKSWKDTDQRAMQVSQLKIEEAYAQIKAELIEQNRIREQQRLEASLASKREEQERFNRALMIDEMQQFQHQTQALQQLKTELDQEILQYTSKFDKNPEQPSVNYAQGQMSISDDQILSELESLKLRLELEAENLIEDAVQQFRNKLNAAAQEEIAYILENSALK